jgi:hypothetical protein
MLIFWVAFFVQITLAHEICQSSVFPSFLGEFSYIFWPNNILLTQPVYIYGIYEKIKVKEQALLANYLIHTYMYIH